MLKDIPTPNKGKRWTPEERAYIVRDDIQIIDMAYELKRSYRSISVLRSRLLRGLPEPKGRRRWTAADEAVLKRDISIVEKCRILDRSYQSVVQKMLKLAA